MSRRHPRKLYSLQWHEASEWAHTSGRPRRPRRPRRALPAQQMMERSIRSFTPGAPRRAGMETEYNGYGIRGISTFGRPNYAIRTPNGIDRGFKISVKHLGLVPLTFGERYAEKRTEKSAYTTVSPVFRA